MRATAQGLCLSLRTLGAPARRAAAVGPSVPQPLHPPRPPGQTRAPQRLTSVTVVFFWSAAARAVAPSSPMSLSAAGQHTRDPEPKSAPHDSKPKHARKGSSHENAQGPTLLAQRAQPEARGRAKALAPPSPHIGRACAAGRGRGPKRPPTPPYPAATRARSRTLEVDRPDRRVLLERGRQSFRAVVADAVPCGGAAHPRTRAQVSATRFQAEAQAQGELARERAGPDAAGRASAARGVRPRKGSPSPSPHIGRACAAGRGRGPKRPPTPPSPAATRARSRTPEVDLRDRRVLLQRGRQSCCAGVADFVACGGAAHPRPRAQVSATRFQAEARARALSLSLSPHRARLRGGPRPWAQASLILPPPAVTGHARAPSRLSDVAPA
jgi:hypothetical protein